MIKQKLFSLSLPTIGIALVGLFVFQLLIMPAKALAQNSNACNTVGVLSPAEAAKCPVGSKANSFDYGTGGDPIKSNGGKCPNGYIKLSIPVEGDKDCIPKGGTDANSNPIFTYLRQFIRFLTAGVGLVVVMMIIIGGIQYTTSGGNPQSIEGAKKKIFHALTALLLFIFMAAILNYLIPGGLL